MSTTAGELLVDVLGDAVRVTSFVDSRISVGYREDSDPTPCIVIDVESVDAGDSLSGTPTLDIVAVNVDCLSTQYSESADIADAVLAALAGSSGTFENKTFSMSAARSAASLSPAPDGGMITSYPIAVIVYMEP
jgi:hypothetical protein